MTPEHALAEAREAEDEIGWNRQSGPLDAIPITLKNGLDLAGPGTTATSAALGDLMPTEDADFD